MPFTWYLLGTLWTFCENLHKILIFLLSISHNFNSTIQYIKNFQLISVTSKWSNTIKKFIFHKGKRNIKLHLPNYPIWQYFLEKRLFIIFVNKIIWLFGLNYEVRIFKKSIQIISYKSSPLTSFKTNNVVGIIGELSCNVFFTITN